VKAECCILFMHHRDDELTRRHLRLLRAHNPFPVVPLHCGQREHLPHAVNVGALADVWRNSDLGYLNWFRRRPFDAERYLWLEYDTFASMPVREFYREVWHCDAAGPRVKSPEQNPDWCWFSERGLLPPSLRSHCGGLSPLSGILLSHRAMTVLAHAAPMPSVFCEFRVGTLLQAAGIRLTALPPERAATVDWTPSSFLFDPATPGIYHPVKGWAGDGAAPAPTS
jgi:hypothetical protein